MADTTTRASGVTAPDEAHVVRALARAIGDRSRQVWTDACRAVPLDPPTAQTPDQVGRALAVLSREGDGVARIVALGQLIRLRTAVAADAEETR